jgi:hypothetical protein
MSAERETAENHLGDPMKANKATRVRTRKAAEKATKTAKLGSGKRFAAVEAAAKASGAKNPAAVAANAGRKAHGARTMAKLASKGRKKNR